MISVAHKLETLTAIKNPDHNPAPIFHCPTHYLQTFHSSIRRQFKALNPQSINKSYRNSCRFFYQQKTFKLVPTCVAYVTNAVAVIFKSAPILIIFIQIRWTSLQFYGVKFPQDSVHQNLLKSVHFWPSHSKYEKAHVFWDTVYYLFNNQQQQT